MALVAAHRDPPEPVAGDDAAAAAGDQAAADVEPRARRTIVAAEVEKNPLLELAPPPRPPAPAAPVAGAATGAARATALSTRWRRRRRSGEHLRAQIGAMRAPPERGRRRRCSSPTSWRRTATCGRRWTRSRRGTGCGRRDAARGAGAGAGLRSGRGRRPQPARVPGAAAARARPARPGDAGAARQPRRSPRAARLAELQALCGVDAEDLADMLAELRALDPKPGLRFAAAAGPGRRCRTCYVARAAPDGGWTVELEHRDPAAGAGQQRLCGAARRGDAATRAFVSECSASASWLVRSLEQRARTILQVATEIVRRQERFFEPRGRRAAAADPAGRGRAARAARIDGEPGDGGQVPVLRAGRASSSGTSSARRSRRSRAARPISAAAVQERIRRLVPGEPGGRPLSDDKIVALLNEEGIDIARRTVAKYREGMGIPSSVERRRQQTSLPGL